METLSATLGMLQDALETKKTEIEKLVETEVTAQMKKVRTFAQTKIVELQQTGVLVRPDDVERVVVAAINKTRVRTLVIKRENAPVVTLPMAHDTLPTLVKLVQTRNTAGQRLNVYLHGPAGSGKSTAAYQAAESLGLRFGYMSLNLMTPDSRALGFIHAGGSYVPTEFFKFYTEGGVFCFDEIDNASASFVTTLNSALENGHGSFPHGIFPRHPDFVCVCTANTIGRGGDIFYPERRALDGAFLERFVFLRWEYDTKLTHAIVGSILGPESAAHLAWMDEKAKYYQAHYPELVISPRAYIQSALLLAQGFTKALIEEATIARGIKNA